MPTLAEFLAGTPISYVGLDAMTYMAVFSRGHDWLIISQPDGSDARGYEADEAAAATFHRGIIVCFRRAA